MSEEFAREFEARGNIVCLSFDSPLSVEQEGKGKGTDNGRDAGGIVSGDTGGDDGGGREGKGGVGSPLFLSPLGKMGTSYICPCIIGEGIGLICSFSWGESSIAS